MNRKLSLNLFLDYSAYVFQQEVRANAARRTIAGLTV